MRRARLFTAVLIGGLLGGCARGATVSEGGDVDLPSNDVAALTVDNQYKNDVDVYAVYDGTSTRLGNVVAHDKGTFPLSPSRYVTGDLQIVARPIGGGGLARSGPVMVSRGSEIAFTIAPVLGQSYVIVR